jgi:hypothetical protein
MQKEVIKKSIEINAPKQKVWQVLLEDSFTRKWYAAFSEGTYAVTDWKEGSKAIFKDDSDSGMVAKVIKNKPEELLFVEHQGVLTNGKEDYESDLAKSMQGGREIYYLSEKDGHAALTIECDMAAEYVESMSGAWDNALQTIKTLSEETV